MKANKLPVNIPKRNGEVHVNLFISCNFSDDSKATLNGPDDWAMHDSFIEIVNQHDLQRNIFCDSVIDSKIKASFKTEEDIKINSENYCSFLDKNI